MLAYIGKRLLIMIPVALAITLIVFTIVNTSADATARLMLGPEASQESLDSLRINLAWTNLLYKDTWSMWKTRSEEILGPHTGPTRRW
jgi:peptide/nickel transport system permease protein